MISSLEINKSDKHLRKDENYINLLLLILLLFFNPLFVLVLGVFLERKYKLIKFVNIIIGFSLALSISNRTIGNSWYSSSDVKGEDDGVNYQNYYHEIKNDSYILDFKDFLINYTDGKEPLWFSMVELVGYLTKFNLQALVFFSVLIPLLIIHHTINLVSPFFCLTSLIYYTLVPETFHTLYHLWRFSLSACILNLAFVHLILNNKINAKLLIIGALGHATSVLMVFSQLLAKTKLIHKKKESKLVLLFEVLLKIFFLSLFITLLLLNLNIDKIIFYFDGEVDLNFTYSIRHYLYMIVSIFLLLKSKNRIIVFFSIVSILLLLLPLVIPTVGVILERILIIITPLIPLMFCFIIKDLHFLRTFVSLPFILLFFYLIYKLDGTLFYQYISNGFFFKWFNGLFYNLLTYPL
jgi:hypothetical protein